LKYKINKSNKRGHFTLIPSIYSKDFYSFETAGKLNYLRKTGKYKDLLRIFKRRRFPNYLKPYGGSQWWALPVHVIDQILKYLENHQDYINYHKFTLLPDEIFFQSIVKQISTSQGIKILPSITYTNWRKKDGPPPVTFTSTDLEELKQAS